MKDLNMNGTATFYFKNQIPYTAIPKEYLIDKKISLKAKGLLTILYALPEEWEYNMKGLTKITGASLKTLRTIIAELEQNYYLFRKRKQDKKGKFYYEYIIDISRNSHVYNLSTNNFDSWEEN